MSHKYNWLRPKTLNIFANAAHPEDFSPRIVTTGWGQEQGSRCKTNTETLCPSPRKGDRGDESGEEKLQT
jgi:hypothetical protein